MLEAVARRCEVPEGRHLFNVDVRGNVGSSGAPSVFSEHWGSDQFGNRGTNSASVRWPFASSAGSAVDQTSQARRL